MINLHFFDWLILGAYLVWILWFSISRFKKNTLSDVEYILGGRRLSLPGLVVTIVCTWYGAILGVGENTFLYGIHSWFIWAFPYYIFAFAYALLIAPKVQRLKMISIPDHFHSKFGEESGIISALFLTVITSPAPYILSMAILLKFFFEIDLGRAIIISVFFSTIYIWNGGLRAIIKTDLIQFILMFTGFIFLLLFSWKTFGSPINIYNNLPENYKDPLGGNSVQYFFVWFFIAAWTLIDPNFFQRCSASKSPETAKKGLLISIIFWFIFDLITVLCGLYAIKHIELSDPLFVYPALAIEVLPVGLLGIFITAIFAIIMSTIDSMSLISGITFGRDVLWRINKKAVPKSSVSHIKKGLVVISVLSILLAFSTPSIVNLFYSIGSVIIPGLIFPFLFSFKIKNNSFVKNWIRLWMVSPVIISLSWLTISRLIGNPLFAIEPFYPGIALSGIITAFIYSKSREIKN